ncbi:esterase, putative [Plesiocystis pacifica SIR-1]|uniref:Esterase, putative n=1 Tax=Plesiocystis pacifica SIR-1 TaxID=391625 RepID=A6GBH4_9BACT|nr:alpha/beta hydrolase [Plesiocystis pacifica]EDM76778.1 esterase, putative [Plesiocystis pacifica SIR-1]
MDAAQPRPAGAAKIRRKTLGGLTIDSPVAVQRAAFARLLELTQIGMPEHTLERREPGALGPRGGLALTPAELTEFQPDPKLEHGTPPRTLVYLHGGGYSLGSPETHRPLAARVARRCRTRALVPRYRLAPEHPCPAGLDDILEAWASLPPTTRARAILAGDSAGGGLALALTMHLRDRGVAGDPDAILPAGLVLLSPWTDLSVSGASVDANAEREVLLYREGLEHMGRAYAGSLPVTDPRVSPLFGRFEGFPPMLVQAGGDEVLLDDARRLASAAAAAGVEVELQVWDGQIHVFQATPMIAAADEALGAIGRWVDALPA